MSKIKDEQSLSSKKTNTSLKSQNMQESADSIMTLKTRNQLKTKMLDTYNEQDAQNTSPEQLLDIILLATTKDPVNTKLINNYGECLRKKIIQLNQLQESKEEQNISTEIAETPTWSQKTNV